MSLWGRIGAIGACSVLAGCTLSVDSPGGGELDGGDPADAAPAADVGPPPSPDAEVPLGAFGDPTVLGVSDPAASDDDAAMRSDLLEIFFESARDGGPFSGGDLWTAIRADAGDPFGDPEPVVELSTASGDSHPELLADGLTIYLVNNTAGSDDIYVATRDAPGGAWTELAPVGELNSGATDDSPTTGDSGRVMIFASNRDGTAGGDDLWESRRDSTAEPWGTPQRLAEVSSADNESSAWLSPDGLVLYFERTPSGAASDLLRAERQALDQPFSAPEPVSELNTDDKESDPWLSPDRRLIMFSRTVDGVQSIYTARR